MKETSVAASEIALLEVEHSSKTVGYAWQFPLRGVLIVGTILVAALASVLKTG